MNEAGDGFALVGFSAQWLWNRAKEGTWATAKPSDAVHATICALANDGTAMALWDAAVGNGASAFAASLSRQDEWSSSATLLAGATARALVRYGDGFLAVLKPTAGGAVSTEYDPELGWLAAKPMIEPGVNGSYWSFAAFSPGALMTWNGPGMRIHVSTFDGDTWTSAELGPGSGGTSTGISAAGRLAGWRNQKSAYIVRGDVDGTWHDPVKLGATDSEDYGPAATVDSSGNALAAWPNGSAIEWRRSLQGSDEWSDIQRIEDQDPVVVLSTVDDAGEVTLVWQNALGVRASRFE